MDEFSLRLRYRKYQNLTWAELDGRSLGKSLPRGCLQKVVHGLERLGAKVVRLLHRQHGVLEVHLSPRVVPQEAGHLSRHSAHGLVCRRIHISNGIHNWFLSYNIPHDMSQHLESIFKFMDRSRSVLEGVLITWFSRQDATERRFLLKEAFFSKSFACRRLCSRSPTISSCVIESVLEAVE